MTLNLPLLYFVWTEEYCQTSPNKNKSPNLWHITSILVCCIFGRAHSYADVVTEFLKNSAIVCIISTGEVEKHQMNTIIFLYKKFRLELFFLELRPEFSRKSRRLQFCVTIMCRNDELSSMMSWVQQWVEFNDELSWLFTTRFRTFYLICRK